uniref:Uncharacterized protein n=1 Tax=Arundo donax TaxID=35708 RepID=A0A0A9FHF4_ARUDO
MQYLQGSLEPSHRPALQ